MQILRRLTASTAMALAALLLTPGFIQGASAGKNKSGNVVRPPAGTPVNQLLLFIPGTGLTASKSIQFLHWAAGKGFHVIGVNYANKTSVGKLCGKDNACFGNVRREIVFGTDLTDKVAVTPETSIVGLVEAELKARHAASPEAGWSRYLNPAGGIDFSLVVPSGHSQGAGHAAILAIDKKVAKVALFNGPNDVVKKKPPSWTKESPADTTDRRLWRAMSHHDEDSIVEQQASWNNLEVGPAPARQVLTDNINGKDPHFALVVDGSLLPNIQAKWSTLLNL